MKKQVVSQHFYTKIDSPIGKIVITSNGKGISGLYTNDHWKFKEVQKGTHDPKIFKDAVKQLDEYFKGKRKRFELELNPQGTDFQKRVWKELTKIGFGKTESYGGIARLVKNPKGSRAIGNANNRNPIAIIVPCHRVIGSTGKLTGYAGGLKTKQWLLDHEISQ